MKAFIEHESRGRLRLFFQVQAMQKRLGVVFLLHVL